MQKTEASWHEQMVRKLQINGKSEQTQQAYTRAVRQLETHCGKNPALISEEELEEYFLYHHGTPTDERFVAQISRAVC